MRTALLSTIERCEPDESGGEGDPRAWCTMGGRPIIEWQLDLARDLGCDRVICLADGPSPQLEHFRERVEAFGLDFQAIGGPRQLAGLVTADQDLVVIAGGVILDREAQRGVLNERRGVAVVPAEAGIAVGFERVDATHAWGGLLVARGRIAEGLAEMPPDSDTVSLLLRLALQAGTPLVNMPPEWLADGTLMLATNARQIELREAALLDRSTNDISWFGPFDASAQRLARRLAPGALVHGPNASSGSSLGLIAGAIALAYYSRTAEAFVALALAALMASLAIGLGGLRARLLGAVPSRNIVFLFKLLLDASAILIMVGPWGGGLPPAQVSLGFLIVGLWRLAERVGPSSIAPLWQDRTLFAAILAAASWLHALAPTLQALALMALAYCLVFAYRPGLTRA
ncbi:MAG: hypothetical protein C0510_02125 [Erythrobacter sp.]|nr:hypothetical protein [Erythrobacter sp.]